MQTQAEQATGVRRYRVDVAEAINAASDLVPHLTGAEFTHMHGVAVYVEKIMTLGVTRVVIQAVSPFDGETAR